jgi:DNA-binding Lrp family transcriptional regulator
MENDMNFDYDYLLVLLQKGLPFVERPLAALGQKCGASEEEVLTVIQELFESDKARRFGGVFDTRRLGFKSSLCAVHLPDAVFDEKLNLLLHENGITHSYRRGQPEELKKIVSQDTTAVPNFWFTYIHDAKTYDQAIADIADRLSPHKLLELPATKRFKVDVIFGAAVDRVHHNPNAPYLQPLKELPPLSEKEKMVVKNLQGNVAVSSDFFHQLAKKSNLSLDELLALLNNLKELGRIKRIGIILKHYNIGMRANGMCVWKVPSDQIDILGKGLAMQPEVTHCYERPGFEGFEYNLYAMIHGKDWTETYGIFQKLSQKLSLETGLLLGSLNEYKKSSPTYFE